MSARRTVIVGTGLAGTRCATTLRRLVPDREILLVGDEPHDAYERPPLSKQFLLGTRDHAELGLAGSDRASLADAGIRTLTSTRVTKLLRGGLQLANDRTLEADQIVLATGARPRSIPSAVDPSRLHVLRSLDDAIRLRAALDRRGTLAIIGSGFVGAEVAGTAHALGLRVVLVEAAPVPFARTLGEAAGTWLAERWRNAGIDVRIGTGVDAIEAGASAPVCLRLADGTRVEADDVLVAIGTVPNDDLFHDAFPSIGAAGRGIPVDADGRTAVDGMFAVGDVALLHDASLATPRRVEHWTDAATGAVRLARVLADQPAGPRPAPYAWSDQFGLRVQVAGDVDPAHRAIVDDEGSGTLLVRYVDHDGKLRGVTAVGHPAAVARYRGELAA